MNDGIYLSMKYEDDSPFVKGRKQMPNKEYYQKHKEQIKANRKKNYHKHKEIKCLKEMVSYWKHRYERMKKKGY